MPDSIDGLNLMDIVYIMDDQTSDQRLDEK